MESLLPNDYERVGGARIFPIIDIESFRDMLVVEDRFLFRQSSHRCAPGNPFAFHSFSSH